MKVHHTPLHHSLLQKHSARWLRVTPPRALPAVQNGCVHALHVPCTMDVPRQPQGTLSGVMLLMQMHGLDGSQLRHRHTAVRLICMPGVAPPA